MLRVTDGQTRPGLTGRSCRVPSNAHLAAWNASSTAFFVVSNDGTAIPRIRRRHDDRVADAAVRDGHRRPRSASTSSQFSLNNPNVIFGAIARSNNRTIAQYDFQAGAYTTVVDLDSLFGGLTNTYIGGLMTGGTTAEKLMTFFGGASQDQHTYVMWTPVGSLSARKVMDTRNSTVNGVATATTLNFRIHSAQIDKSGRFVLITPSSADLGAPRNAAQVYIWDTDNDSVTAVTSNMLAGGHDAAGYGVWINQDCCTSSTWDAAQWQFRDLTNVHQTSDLISPVLASKEIYLADHTTWNNAAVNAVPVSSTYRYGNNTAPWRAWDDRIIGTDDERHRRHRVALCHHRSNIGSEADPTQP